MEGSTHVCTYLGQQAATALPTTTTTTTRADGGGRGGARAACAPATHSWQRKRRRRPALPVGGVGCDEHGGRRGHSSTNSSTQHAKGSNARESLAAAGCSRARRRWTQRRIHHASPNPSSTRTWLSIPMRCLDGLALTFIHARPLPSAQADLILRGARPNEEGEERQLPPLRSIIIIVVVVGFAASAASASRPAAACGSACGSGTGRCGHRWRPPCSSPGL